MAGFVHSHQFLKETEQVFKVGIAFAAVGCVLSHESSSYLSGVRGFVYSLVSNVEIQVIHPLHHPPLSLVSDLGRLFDGDTCGENGKHELSDEARNGCPTSASACTFQRCTQEVPPTPTQQQQQQQTSSQVFCLRRCIYLLRGILT